MDYNEESEEILNTEEEETSINDEQEDVEEEQASDLEERLKKAEEIAENQRIRAEKAEKKAKANTAKEGTSKKYSLEEIEDITALSSIPKEDRQEVLDYAESKGIKPSEALANPMITAYLKSQEEVRKTAQASNTGGSKRGSAKTSGDQLIKDFESGKAIKDDDIQALVEAQMARKKAIRNGA